LNSELTLKKKIVNVSDFIDGRLGLEVELFDNENRRTGTLQLVVSTYSS